MKKIFLTLIVIILCKSLNAEKINNDTTIITTDGGINVYQEQKYYDLKKNVIINSKNFNLKADNVVAHYNKDFYDLTKIIATGNAEIITLEKSEIKGDKLTYDINSGNFVIIGNGIFINDELRVEGEEMQGTIIEVDKVRYIKKVEVKDSKKVFIKNKDMKSYSKSAIYLKENDVLELFDEVKIIKGSEVTTGDYANINLKTNDYSIKSVNNKVKLLISSDD